MRNVRDYDPPKDYHRVATAGSAVAPLLHLYLTVTAKMEDSIAKLKHFSKLDFQSKREVINNGRPMPELKGMLQTTDLATKVVFPGYGYRIAVLAKETLNNLSINDLNGRVTFA